MYRLPTRPTPRCRLTTGDRPPRYPVGVLLAGTAEINFLTAVPLMGFLALATLLFIVFTRTHLELTNVEAVSLLVLYGLFLLWMSLESVGLLETVRGI